MAKRLWENYQSFPEECRRVLEANRIVEGVIVPACNDVNNCAATHNSGVLKLSLQKLCRVLANTEVVVRQYTAATREH